MATKRTLICDRCGKEYELNGRWRVEVERVKKYNPLNALFNSNFEPTYRTLDLCGDCTGQLHDWLRGGDYERD